jgi:SAM-dependent methyltransferase
MTYSLTIDAALEASVARDLAPADHMFGANLPHYFGVGRSALNCIDLAARCAGRQKAFATILDFACGSGRVTRWLRAAFPDAAITVADVREDGVEFCKRAFAADGFLSSPDFGAIDHSGRYDLIWVGSLFTHISEEDTRILLDKLTSWLEPHGLLVATFQGRTTILNQLSRKARYTSPEKFMKLMADAHAKGFGYVDYDGQEGLGVSLTFPAWIGQWVPTQTHIRLAMTSERLWDNHQDVVALERLPPL